MSVDRRSSAQEMLAGLSCNGSLQDAAYPRRVEAMTTSCVKIFNVDSINRKYIECLTQKEPHGKNLVTTAAP